MIVKIKTANSEIKLNNGSSISSEIKRSILDLLKGRLNNSTSICLVNNRGEKFEHTIKGYKLDNNFVLDKTFIFFEEDNIDSIRFSKVKSTTSALNNRALDTKADFYFKAMNKGYGYKLKNLIRYMISEKNNVILFVGDDIRNKVDIDLFIETFETKIEQIIYWNKE